MIAFVPMLAFPALVAVILKRVVTNGASMARVVVAPISRGNRCTHRAADGATEDRLVASP